MNEQNLQRSANIIKHTFDRLRFGNEHLKWFLCFGGLLALVRDNGLLKGKDGKVREGEDIDIGCLFEEINFQNNVPQLINGFERMNYKLKKKVVTDTDGKLIYCSFISPVLNLPDVCVFAWILSKDGNRYHTYDIKFEGREVLSEYTMKGVPAWCFDKVIRWYSKEANREINIPVKYGTLLDYWYPMWIKPAEGQSETPYKKTIKSFREFT